ncbi:Homeobox domain-containing protein [Metschnikowia aff. pulcherrima]|uniref:Homeobox domain-containing protein n=1 Tax=Metschnikowia aff. pulcherrima TaxID=2163413 RepID=A0A4P6XSY7_9ASCO|nr:Homeobox domain-containing protein [Metschnikowia aff. pulcherrima]
MQLERRVFLKRSLNKLMVKPQSIGCRINSALISVKHYKERLYRRRNVLSKAAKRYLEASYSIGCYPNKIERERIAKNCNLSPQQVRVWVRNPLMKFHLELTNNSLAIGAIVTRAEKMQ